MLKTLVNISAYYFLAYPIQLGMMSSTTIVWGLAVLFAYITSKNWVFHKELIEKAAIIKGIVSSFIRR